MRLIAFSLAVLVLGSATCWANERVVLGESDLLAGIPGEGALSIDEIEAWLKDPKNHEPLEPRLPKGLDAGQADIKGLDENPLTRAKIELGRQLYFDRRLSLDSSVSCADCHKPDHGYAASTRFGIGIEDQTGNRNSPTSCNRILSATQFWDGRSGTLEEQAIGPIANPIEMGFTHDACVKRLEGIEGYRLQFTRIFGGAVSIEAVGKALAAFERTLVTGPTPWDHYQRLTTFEELTAGEQLTKEDLTLRAELQRAVMSHPLSESATRGAKLFFSDRTGCVQCHVGANFTDEQYHNLGVGMEKADKLDDETIDWGRFSITGDEVDRGAFKTPTLRNVAQTAPYMHDGSLETLTEVVEWYVMGGHENRWLSEKMEPLDLDSDEVDDLVAFLEALTGDLPKVQQGRLPE